VPQWEHRSYWTMQSRQKSKRSEAKLAVAPEPCSTPAARTNTHSPTSANVHMNTRKIAYAIVTHWSVLMTCNNAPVPTHGAKQSKRSCPEHSSYLQEHAAILGRSTPAKTFSQVHESLRERERERARARTIARASERERASGSERERESL
jgi:hypothetical protein